MPTLTDRHGLALSTRSPSAVERFDHGLDLQLSLNAGGVEGLASAVEADPDLALGHAALAFALWYRSQVSYTEPRLCYNRHIGGSQGLLISLSTGKERL